MSARPTAANPNHHLWQHGRQWWVSCSVNPTPKTKDKLRRSLQTDCAEIARFRRDQLFRLLQSEGLLGSPRGIQKAPIAARVPVSPGLSWEQRIEAILAVVTAFSPSPRTLPAPVVGSGQGKLQLYRS